MQSIQIYGAGMSGTFLFYLLKNEGFDVKIKDIRKTPDCRCAWGTMYKEAKELYKMIGLDLDDYILSKPKEIIANSIEFKNKYVVIFDRKRLLEDLWKDLKFGEINANLFVDATGAARKYLPLIANDKIYPTIQYLEKVEDSKDENIYIYLRKTGYAWAFPLGGDYWHIGAGDIDENRALELINKLREYYDFRTKEKVCECKAKVRLLPPSKCKPFVYNNIVGVGEAIGCVSGLGEGNAPSLKCATILFECIKNNRINEYENIVLKEFEWIEREHEFVEAVQNNERVKALRLLPRVVLFESKRSVEKSLSNFRSLLKLLGI